MRTCFSIDPLTIDPRKNGDQITSTFLSLIYDALTRLKPNGEPELALAESVEISPDQKTYRFHLREAYWSDGHPLTAHDFAYSWLKGLDPKFPCLSPQLFFPIKNAEAASLGLVPLDEVGIRALSDTILEIELQHPTSYFLSLLSFCNFCPIPKHIETKNGEWENAPVHELVTSGAFKIAKWKSKCEIVCEKNPLYWDAKNVTLDSIHISIINNPYSILQLFDQDELDLVSVSLCSLPFEALSAYREEGLLKFFPMGGTVFCSFNMHQYPFHNQNIRKAFSYAIDPRFIVEKVTRFNEIPAMRCLPPSLTQNENEALFPGFDESLARKHLTEGLKELEESGDPDMAIRLFLSNLTLTFVSNQTNRKIVEALQERWRQVLGFNVRLESCDYSSYIQRFNKGKYSLGLAYWLAQFNDPMSIFERFKSRSLPKNLPGYENPRFNELLNLSSCEANPVERKKILAQAESLFLDDMPLSPIYHYNHACLCKPHLTGVQINVIGGFHFHQSQSSPSPQNRYTMAVS